MHGKIRHDVGHLFQAATDCMGTGCVETIGKVVSGEGEKIEGDEEI